MMKIKNANITNKTKRALALMLSFVMVFALLPVFAQAAANDTKLVLIENGDAYDYDSKSSITNKYTFEARRNGAVDTSFSGTYGNLTFTNGVSDEITAGRYELIAFFEIPADVSIVLTSSRYSYQEAGSWSNGLDKSIIEYYPRTVERVVMIRNTATGYTPWGSYPYEVAYSFFLYRMSDGSLASDVSGTYGEMVFENGRTVSINSEDSFYWGESIQPYWFRAAERRVIADLPKGVGIDFGYSFNSGEYHEPEPDNARPLIRTYYPEKTAATAHTVTYQVMGSGPLTTSYRAEDYPAMEYEAGVTASVKPDLTCSPTETTRVVNGETQRGTWRFSGWETDDAEVNSNGSFTMPDNDVTFIGVWLFEESQGEPSIAYSVHYQVTGEGPETSSYHADTYADADYEVGTEVQVKADLTCSPTETTRVVNGETQRGTWRFSGWETDDAEVSSNGSFTMPDNNVTFTGYWTFHEDPKYTVRYMVEGEEPSAFFPNTIYMDEQYYAGEEVEINADLRATVRQRINQEGDAERGTWTFEGWVPSDSSVTITNGKFIMPASAAGVTLMGSWSFSLSAADEYAITKEILTGIGTTTPIGSFYFTVMPNTSVTNNAAGETISIVTDETLYPNIGTKSIAFTASDTGIEDTVNNTLRIQKSTESILPDITEFTEAGIYVYDITENDDTAAGNPSSSITGMEYSKAVYRMYIWISDDGTGFLDYEYVAIVFVNENGTTGAKLYEASKGEKTEEILFINSYTKYDSLELEKQLGVGTAIPTYKGDNATDPQGAIDRFGFNVKVLKPASSDESVLKAYLMQKNGNIWSYVTNGTEAAKWLGNNTPAVSVDYDARGFYIPFVVEDAQGNSVEASVNIKLKHDQKLSFESIPVGTRFITEETAYGEYTPSTAVTLGARIDPVTTGVTRVSSGVQRVEESPALSDGNRVVTTNSFVSPPMGILMNNLPFFVLIALVIAAFVLYVVIRGKCRQRQEENYDTDRE